MIDVRRIATASNCATLGIAILALSCSSGCGSAVTAGGSKAAELTPQEAGSLQERIDRVRSMNQRRYMNTREHAAWQLIHGILAYQDKLLVDHYDAGENKQRVKAIDLILSGGNVRGLTFQPRADGSLATLVEGGSKTGQGHPNQWLGYLLVDYPPRPGRAPTVTPDTKIKFRYNNGETRDFTITDMIRAAKLALRPGQESGWSLIGLTAFPELVPFDQEWDVVYEELTPADTAAKDSQDGKSEKPKPPTEKWSVQRIVEMETNISVIEQRSAPRGLMLSDEFHATSCGGTHRLIGLSVALQRYREHLRRKAEAAGEREPGEPPPLTGVWQRAEQLVALGVDTIKQQQSEGGAFSAAWLQRAGTSQDIAVRIRTTGHCLEFLALTLSSEELAQNWVAAAAFHLCDLLDQTPDMAIDCGALYHALHGLQVYREKRWGVPK